MAWLGRWFSREPRTSTPRSNQAGFACRRHRRRKRHRARVRRRTGPTRRASRRDISLDRAEDTALEIRNSGGTATAIECDVTDIAAVESLAESGEEWFGQAADLVINNAGVGHGGHLFTPRLRALGHGGIINVSSAAGFSAAQRMSAYNVSKAGVLALSETLAAEPAGSGIRVTVLCPTVVKTNIGKDGRISGDAVQLLETAMKWTGRSADSVARTTLDAHEHGELYVLPQLDARLAWRAKRQAPRTYTRSLGLLNRTGLGGTAAATNGE